MNTITVRTQSREAMLDITAHLEPLVANVNAGVLVVYTPHTTTGLTINEGADPDVRNDILAYFRTLVPQHNGFRHAEGNADAHIKATLFGSSVQIIIAEGRLVLGTWQRVFLGEFDGPRTRTILTQILS